MIQLTTTNMVIIVMAFFVGGGGTAACLFFMFRDQLLERALDRREREVYGPMLERLAQFEAAAAARSQWYPHHVPAKNPAHRAPVPPPAAPPAAPSASASVVAPTVRPAVPPPATGPAAISLAAFPPPPWRGRDRRR